MIENALERNEESSDSRTISILARRLGQGLKVGIGDQQLRVTIAQIDNDTSSIGFAIVNGSSKTVTLNPGDDPIGLGYGSSLEVNTRGRINVYSPPKAWTWYCTDHRYN